MLEELDGRPIIPLRGPSRAMAWPRAMVAATAAVASRPRLWVLALLAFLARGGLVPLVIPMLVLPTFVGISNIVGPTSVTAAGPTPRLVAMVAAWLGVVLVVIVAGTLIAAPAEVALYRATGAPGADTTGGGLRSRAAAPAFLSGRRAALRVAAVRLWLLLPVALVLVVAVPAWVQVAYRELLLPSDLAVPLPVRVVAGAPLPAAGLVAMWLATEVLGGLAGRRIALRGSAIAAALKGAAGDVVRAPVAVLLTLALGIAGTLLVLVPAIAVVGGAWAHSRIALVDGPDAAGVILATFALVAAWAACLGVAGITAAWRSLLWTAELARRSRAGSATPGLDARATLAG